MSRRQLTTDFRLEDRLAPANTPPELVRDINPTAFGNPQNTILANGILYFAANDGVTGNELWRSDGTESGTFLIADLEPGNVYGTPLSSSPRQFTNVNGTIFFTANVNNQSELWKTDGTSAGTSLVRDLDPQSSAFPTSLTNVNGVLFFYASTSTQGRELWKSDGTSAGTVLVADLATGEASSVGFSPGVNVGGIFYFPANALDAGNPTDFGVELWRSDGTAKGTFMVRDINAGGASSYPNNLTEYKGQLAFFATGNPSNFFADLWISDGTEMGTEQISDINTASFGLNPDELYNAGDKLYFRAFEPNTGFELWSSDGTAKNTNLLADINPGPGNSTPGGFATVGSFVYFHADDGVVGDELWLTNGAASGTKLVADIHPSTGFGADIQFITNVGGVAYFSAKSINIFADLWRSDGTAAGTTKILMTDGSQADPRNLVARGNDLFFTGFRNDVGLELFKLNEDNLAPTILNIDSPDPDASYYTGQSLTITVTFSERVTLRGGRLLLQLDSGATVAIDPFDGVAGSVIYTVGPNDLSNDLNVVGISLEPGATLRDLVGNDANLALPTQNLAVTSDLQINLPQTPPTISDIPDQEVIAGQTIGPLTFIVGDLQTPAVSLIVTVASSNPALIPASAILIGGVGADRTIELPTLPGIPGLTTITVTVTDSTGLTASDSFIVAQNTAPTISDIPDLGPVVAGTVVGPIAFTINGGLTPPDQLVLSVASDNPLLPASLVTIDGAGANRTLTITPPPGVVGVANFRVTVLNPALDLTANDTFSLTLTAPIQPTILGDFTVGRGPLLETSVLQFRNPDGSLRATLAPFGPNYTCGVQAVTADFNGDGVPDILVGTNKNPTLPAQISIFDGASQKLLFNTIVFGTDNRGGVLVSAGDITGDGRAEAIVTSERGGGARVRIFSLTSTGFVQIADFFGLIGSDGVPDTTFRGGARTSVGDFNGDGFGDLVFAAGTGGGPRVAIFDGRQLGMNGGPKLVGDFFALEPNLRNGVYVAAGDIDGDGKADLAVAPSVGGAPRVRIFSGAGLLNDQRITVADFFAGSVTARGGLRIAIKDLNGDRLGDLVIGDGPGDGNRVAAFSNADLRQNKTSSPLFDFIAYEGWLSGIFVG